MVNDIIYSLNREDVQSVAGDLLLRELSDDELQNVEQKLGDYIDWYTAIEHTIREISER